ncbi:hypothetical protein HN018_09395 [Lichenicola cladoniae]|uniref:Uncharacterized protein n=1 Tax=Lichenicola cladoniae TaxID=1484109 RepID=A0A6M8HPL6_9PROT|nr:hypothetical protein [Lichenicola cladoniae]NPD66559.1 hypothetical protein [Acetobacteraceae bacterium]QKE90230.1 hypothetical protein HN018_09395 [Lichenicola cladoniae]
MTPARFAALADAYGSKIERWPDAERDAARHHLASRPEARAVLAEAAWLDTRLESWTLPRPGPGAALTGRIMAAATRAKARRRWLQVWLSGLGTAATLVGGLATGAGVIALWAPSDDQAGASLYQVDVLGAPLELGEHQPTENRS